MTDYVIFTDSTTDLPQEIADRFQIRVLPLSFQIDDKKYKNYLDGRELASRDFYEMVRQGKIAITSQVNYNDFKEAFEETLKEGKDVLYIGCSSGISGTYNSAATAARDLKEQYPDRKIYAVDSLCASLGEGLLVYYAANKKEEGCMIDDLRDWLEENKLHLCHWFTVDDLNHLKRGGRVSAVTAAVGTTLKVKPVLHVDDAGLLIPMSNVMGRKKSLKSLVDNMIKTCEAPDGQSVFIGHGDTPEDAEYVKSLVLKAFPSVKEVLVHTIGPVIGAHAGPGTIALFFLGTHR